MTIVCSATIKLTTTENKLADRHLAARNSSIFKCTERKNPLKYLGSQTMPVLSQFQISFHVFVDFATRVWNCVCYLFKRNIKAYEPIKYKIHPLSPVSRHRLGLVSKKILVLDLDETLVHSCHATLSRNTVKPGTPYDFRVNVIVDKQLVTFYVYKRPHVDFFLKIVSKWYDVVLFTASLEVYGDAVADKLDRGKNIIRRRYYRQHCTPDYGSYTKDISAVCNDLNRICIVDNSPAAYRCFPNNAIPIQSYLTDPMDTALLKLLPLLDALRFTKDVRSVLSRNLHLNRTW